MSFPTLGGPLEYLKGRHAMSDMNDQPGRHARGGSTSAPTEATATDETTATGQYNVPRQTTTSYDDMISGRDREADSGAAAGLTIMAAVIMMIAGILGFFEGLAGIIKGTFFVVLPNYSFSLSATSWGVIHLIIGALVFVVGAALLTGNRWARYAGVVIAAFSAIANFVFLPYYPVWAIVVIALDIFVIWALLTPRNPLRRPA
jgi:hypothetical protein